MTLNYYLAELEPDEGDIFDHSFLVSLAAYSLTWSDVGILSSEGRC